VQNCAGEAGRDNRFQSIQRIVLPMVIFIGAHVRTEYFKGYGGMACQQI